MVSCRNLGFRYREGQALFHDISIDFPENAITAILGPSGCGKTTLLHLMARILEPLSGTVESGGAEDQPVSYLFQEPRLLPWARVLENVLLVNRDRHSALDHLRLVGLGEKADAYPGELSGGMRQRLAMARAFAFPAPLLLMDEPFQALDIALRFSLVEAFRTLWQEDPRTTIFVTHDIQEALLLGDRILIMKGEPVEIIGDYNNPVAQGKLRKLGGKELMDLESKLYRLLIPS